MRQVLGLRFSYPTPVFALRAQGGQGYGLKGERVLRDSKRIGPSHFALRMTTLQVALVDLRFSRPTLREEREGWGTPVFALRALGGQGCGLKGERVQRDSKRIGPSRFALRMTTRFS